MSRRSSRRWAVVGLGAGLWLAAIGAVAGSTYTVTGRLLRPVTMLRIEGGSSSRLAPGDSVFSDSQRGLVRIGEVASRDDNGAIELAIDPSMFDALSASTVAVCWGTPMSAEEAITALLPPAIHRRVAEAIAADWRENEDAVMAAWKPVAKELVAAYISAVGDDFETALTDHQDEIWAVAKNHADAVSADWPAIQTRLQPIVQAHLTPVLSRLMHDALTEAPKARIAYNIVRRRYEEAYQYMLDWLTDYLGSMSDRDRAELASAVRASWAAAREDAVLMEIVARQGRDLRDDPELHRVLGAIYREVVAENPTTSEFVRTEILESQAVQDELYRFVERFGPTARKVAALCLFDDEGTTRPEVVHLVRSVALRREVSWVTLDTPPGDAPPLEPGALVPIFRTDRTP
jgi:hypothetical protein